MTYEESVLRLQAIVSELEGDRLPLAQALALFEEGVARLREATAALADADTRVQTLVESIDGSLSIADQRS
ncbi:MAG: exodeoxyribonuclease VII small subunit [Gemmatimonadaceae bacterium]|nr:exodeoxyribonuclease VII small subunit [Gemmatimonadaceae bacterium]